MVRFFPLLICKMRATLVFLLVSQYTLSLVTFRLDPSILLWHCYRWKEQGSTFLDDGRRRLLRTSGLVATMIAVYHRQGVQLLISYSLHIRVIFLSRYSQKIFSQRAACATFV